MDESGTVPLLAVAGGVATITLNRPRHHNRLESTDLQVLEQHIRTVEADPSVRVLVLSAQVRGPRPVFSAGFDLGGFDRHPHGPGGAVDAFARVADALAAARPITLAALGGSVMGGAVDLALACDFRIGVQGMQVRVPAAALGLHYYSSGLRRAVATLGLPLARRLWLAAETLQDEALLTSGFLDACVPAADLSGEVQRRVQALLALAPLALQGMKRTLRELAEGGGEPQAWRARELATHASADFAEGRAAALARRAPRFEGR
ncbi:MAG: enoyl-CoA hydratase/isomerase family protein [Tepidimonas sp.]|uniref:enoyl-CoA hydratase/isomerase family protein n=1 Tax=Tepidimonas sp. TaxID=2002775 RepID=UPI00298EF1B6|nr:enoyl-CoA hydratase/isomerase family protein [Tepidimonas sp.]MCS6810563.1 enoyl-CoA hydratase/isomerase family protein [Tepidimonas sp.]MDW8337012.1 enoyl-CoA hydratase/isomerase family protein [Tepidimonas sp.]